MKKKVKKKTIKKVVKKVKKKIRIEGYDEFLLKEKIERLLSSIPSHCVYFILTVLLKEFLINLRQEKGDTFADGIINDLFIYLNHEDYMKILMEKGSFSK